MAYATVAELKVRFDVRTLGDLAGDTGVSVPGVSLLTDANVLAVLDDASGEIESAILVGKRYTTIQLTALTGNANSYLVRICCEIAMHLLVERRLYSATADHSQRMLDRYTQRLDDLRTGRRIFDIDDAKSVPSNDGPTTGQRSRMNYISERARGHFYPAMRLPDGR